MPTIKQSKVTPDAKRAKATVKALSRREKEEQRRRAQRTAYLKRRGVLAALGIAAMLAVVLLIAKWNKPAATDNVSPKDAVVSNKDKDTVVADMKPRSVGVKSKVQQGDGVQSYTLTQEELIRSLPKFADITAEQLVYPKQMPSGIDPDFFKPVMVFTSSESNRAEDERQIVNMAIQQGLIAARVGSTKYAFYAPDNHPLYKNSPAK
jgi:hypothetical protein